ncbi:MAG: hypothetical protein IMZ61_15025 [Planctomycetes bacterium]|nr:hypothetical protein [Planctomycetota bacterium]
MSEQIVATYDYTDELGNPLYQVVRYFPKTFRARRWINNVWVAGKGDRGPVPFNLPWVVEAAHNEGIIFICEGEKDTQNLSKALSHLLEFELRKVAVTTAPFGSNNWKPEFRRYFIGASQVVILPDNDKPGHEYAMTIARSLTGTIPDIRIVDLPDLAEKEDVTDWLEKGNPIWALWLEVYQTPPLVLPKEPDIPMILHALKRAPIKIEPRPSEGRDIMFTIEAINQRGIEILSRYVELERAGRNRFKFICPFHEDTQPSGVLYADRGHWWCYGCGTGGDIIDFEQKKNGSSFREVINTILPLYAK